VSGCVPVAAAACLPLTYKQKDISKSFTSLVSTHKNTSITWHLQQCTRASTTPLVAALKITKCSNSSSTAELAVGSWAYSGKYSRAAAVVGNSCQTN
jgi:hypothetical protein